MKRKWVYDMNKTINYYNENAKTFVEGTVSVDFSDIQTKFINKLNDNAKILDFGCGSGRDTKFFLANGFDVEAIDGSEELCKFASEYTGINVKHMYFQQLDEVSKYDAVWACSSILHLSYDELIDVMKKIVDSLKPNGLFYTSFKYGDFEGDRNGRYFINMDEIRISSLLENIEHLQIEEMWITIDVRPNRGEEKWINLFMRKK